MRRPWFARGAQEQDARTCCGDTASLARPQPPCSHFGKEKMNGTVLYDFAVPCLAATRKAKLDATPWGRYSIGRRAPALQRANGRAIQGSSLLSCHLELSAGPERRWPGSLLRFQSSRSAIVMIVTIQISCQQKRGQIITEPADDVPNEVIPEPEGCCVVWPCSRLLHRRK